MARVPYNPTNQVAPQSQPTPYNSGGAGQSLGRSVAGFGTAVGRAGDELYASVIRAQDMLNDADAKALDVQAMTEIGRLTADFQQLEGREAVNAYDKYVADVKTVRQNTLAQATNPTVRHSLDQTLLARVGYAETSASAHTAQQVKAYAANASVARQQALTSTAVTAEGDQFKNTVSALADETRQEGLAKGLAPEAIDQMIAQKTGAAWTGRAQYIAMTDPLGAKKFFEENRDKMDPATRVSVEQVVTQRMLQVGSRQVADDVITRNINPTKLTLRGTPDMKLSAGADAMVKGVVASGVVPELKITSGHRDVARNTAAGGAKDSQHISGNAVDIDISDYTDEQKTALLKELVANGARGIGIYQGGKSLHADVRETPATWGPSLDKYAGVDPDKQPVWAQQVLKDMFSGAIPKKTMAEPVREGQLPDLLKQAETKAEELYPGNVQFREMVQDHVRTNYNIQIKQQQDLDRARYDVVQNLVTGLDTGKPLLRVSDIEANPSAWEAYNKLPDYKKRVVQKQLERNNSTRQMSEDQLQRYLTSLGEAVTDPDTFLSKDVMDMDLPTSKVVELKKMQDSIIKARIRGGDANPHLSSAVSMLDQTGVMKAAGLSDKKSARRMQFVGALQMAMQRYVEDNKKQPGIDDIKKMSQGLLTEVSTGSFWDFFGKQKLYQTGTPEDIGNKVYSETPKVEKVPASVAGNIRERYAAAHPGQPPLTDEQVLKVYLANKGR